MVVTTKLKFCLPAVLLAASFAPGQDAQSSVQTVPLKAEEIMARVAGNQERSETLRDDYVYNQHIHIATHKPQNRMMREENADYEVSSLPGTYDMPVRIQKRLRLLTGRYWKKDKYVDLQVDPAKEKSKTNSGSDLIQDLQSYEPAPLSGSSDEDLIRFLRGYLLDDKSKDGLGRALFPLTQELQRNYIFTLLGQEVDEGRNCYHIAFSPKDGNALTWTGEAFIDAAEFQPVRVFTKMSHRAPFLVRTMWFDFPGLGFNVVYQRQPDGVWFPWIFGTEFRMHAGPVLFFNRDVAIAVENSNFQHVRAVAK
jgi:hypothetical protein